MFIWLGLTLLLGLGGVLWMGARHWDFETSELRRRLEQTGQKPITKCYQEGELEALPEVVQRFFRAVLRQGQPIITGVEMELRGQFNMAQDGEKWRPFRSTQKVRTQRPGFDWDARIQIFPGCDVRVHDAYIAGEGFLHASLLGLLSIARMRGSKSLNEGELMRFLAEAAWYPTALLPSQGVVWEAVDDHSARASLQDQEVKVCLLFRFLEDGPIASVFAEARGRLQGEKVVATAWEGQWREYQRRDGILVPSHGEVAWLPPEGRLAYWRGQLMAIRYEGA